MNTISKTTPIHKSQRLLQFERMLNELVFVLHAMVLMKGGVKIN
jgi:hypothetical protein